MTVNAITDTKKGRTGIAPTYLHTTRHNQMLVDGKPERFQFLSETYTVSTEEACRLLPGDNIFYGTL